MKTVAIEDLMSDVILDFCENLAELGCPENQSPDMWFRYLSDNARRKVMDKLLDIIERDYANYKASKNNEPVCCFCKISDKNVKTTKRGTPMHIQCLHNATLGSLEEELFGDDNSLPIEVKESNHVVVDPWICLDCGAKYEPTGNTQCPACFSSNTESEDLDDLDDSKTVIMKEISVELDYDLIEGLLEIARSKIVNDKQALINYGANLILKKFIETKGRLDDNL